MPSRSTLVLDQGYQPVRVISWRRAICMSFLGKVEVLSSHGWHVHTVTQSFLAPAVVRLLHQARTGPLHVRFSRQNVYLRDGHSCQYCGNTFSSRELTLDHVVPRSKGGRTTWRNVVAACAPCNRTKGGRTPEQAGLRLRRSPSRPRWMPAVAFGGGDRVPEVWLDWLH